MRLKGFTNSKVRNLSEKGCVLETRDPEHMRSTNIDKEEGIEAKTRRIIKTDKGFKVLTQLLLKIMSKDKNMSSNKESYF